MIKQHKTHCPLNPPLHSARYALVAALSPIRLLMSRRAIAILAMAALVPNVRGEGGGIATDGSFGVPAQVLGESNMTLVDIPQNLGKVEGGNLFHSFAHFNIDQGQTVTFQENITHTLDNVFARVTGGAASNINGNLVSTPGGHANFYLVNPAGAMFGSGATLNVAGDFHVGTADEIRFQDGGNFNAKLSESSRLSAAAPAAFGFSGTSLANNSLLKVDGAQLAVNPGKTIDMVGGNISIGNGARLQASSGEIRLVARQDAGEVGLVRDDNGHLPLPAEAPTTDTAGSLAIQNGTLDTSGDGGGRIGFWGGDVSINGADASVTVGNTGDKMPGSAGGAEIRGASISSDGGNVNVYATGRGEAGELRVEATGNLVLENNAVLQNTSLGSGRTGNIFLSAGNNLTVAHESSIYISTSGDSAVGAVVMQANGDILLENAAGIYAANPDGSHGPAGYISVSAGKNICIGNGAIIDSSSFGEGDAGLVSLKADGDIILINRGKIRTDTWSSGQGGTVSLQAGGNVVMEGQTTSDDQSALIISSSTQKGSTGNAGTINIDAAGDITLLNRGAISSDTGAQGRGGNVNVKANNIRLDRGGISAKATEKSTGLTGQVEVVARDMLTLDHAGTISVENQGINTSQTGSNANSLKVFAPNIVLSNGSQITTRSTGNLSASAIAIGFSNQLHLNNAIISTSAHDGHGGAISIRGGGLIGLRNTQIITSVTGNTNGNGGNIAISGDTLLLQSATITADTVAAAHGGDINLNLKGIVADGDNLNVGGNRLITGKPNTPGWNLIRAAAPDGVSGLIQFATPQLNLSGALTGLGGPQFQVTALDGRYCTRSNGSSLTRISQGRPLTTGDD